MSDRLDANSGVNRHAPKVDSRPICQYQQIAQLHIANGRGIIIVAVIAIAKNASAPLLVNAHGPLFREVCGHILQNGRPIPGMATAFERFAIQCEFAVSDWDHNLGRIDDLLVTHWKKTYAKALTT